MGKGYYFTLSIEIPNEISEQKAREIYSHQNYINSLKDQYGCEVDFIRVANKRAEYKIYMYVKGDVVNG